MNKRGQVWIETVLYTLIGLALIGLVLAFVTPKITETKDKLAVDQSINSLNSLDTKVNAVLDAPGNVRFVDFTMRRGELFIDEVNDKIRFVISDLVKPYSQVGVNISVGRIVLRSEETQKTFPINLELSYSGLVDLKCAGSEVEKKFTASSVPYTFGVTNDGDGDGDGVIEVCIRERGA